MILHGRYVSSPTLVHIRGCSPRSWELWIKSSKWVKSPEESWCHVLRGRWDLGRSWMRLCHIYPHVLFFKDLEKNMKNHEKPYMLNEEGSGFPQRTIDPLINEEGSGKFPEMKGWKCYRPIKCQPVLPSRSMSFGGMLVGNLMSGPLSSRPGVHRISLLRGLHVDECDNHHTYSMYIYIYRYNMI